MWKYHLILCRVVFRIEVHTTSWRRHTSHHAIETERISLEWQERMSSVTRKNELCDTKEWALWHERMSSSCFHHPSQPPFHIRTQEKRNRWYNPWSISIFQELLTDTPTTPSKHTQASSHTHPHRHRQTHSHTHRHQHRHRHRKRLRHRQSHTRHTRTHTHTHTHTLSLSFSAIVWYGEAPSG